MKIVCIGAGYVGVSSSCPSIVFALHHTDVSLQICISRIRCIYVCSDTFATCANPAPAHHACTPRSCKSMCRSDSCWILLAHSSEGIRACRRIWLSRSIFTPVIYSSAGCECQMTFRSLLRLQGPTMAMIAYKCPDITVVVVDINAARIAAWNSDVSPGHV